MAITVTPAIATHASNPSAETTTGNITFTHAAPAGSVLVAWFGGNGTPGTLGISDSKSNVWTLVQQELNTGATKSWLNVYSCLVTNPITTSDTVAATDTTSQTLLLSVDLLTSATSVLDGSVLVGQSTGASPIALAAMTVTVGDIVYHGTAINDSAGAFTLGAGFSLSVQETAAVALARSLYVQYQVATTTSVTPSMTPANSKPYATIAFAFKAEIDQALTGVAATSSSAAPAGSVAAGATITGVVATSTGVAPAGVVAVSVTGVTATSTSVAPAGSVAATVTVTGVAAPSVSVAPAGTVKAGATITGVTATATSVAPVGTVSAGDTIVGVTATATAVAPVGVVSAGAHVTGVTATAASLAPAGAVHAGATLQGLVAQANSQALAGLVNVARNIQGVTATSVSAAPAGSIKIFVPRDITLSASGAPSRWVTAGTTSRWRTSTVPYRWTAEGAD